MKKQYIKPAIIFDSLAMSANISSGCSLIAGNEAQYVCKVKDPETGWTFFTDQAICNMTLAPGDTICYDIPFAGSNVFES